MTTSDRRSKYYLRLGTDLGRNPKVAVACEIAGLPALASWIAVLLAHAERGGNGTIPAKDARVAVLARSHAPSFGLSSEQLAGGLDALAEAGLIERSPAGDLRICGWDESWMPACAQCRRPNPEPAFRVCPNCREKARDERARKASRRESEKARKKASRKVSRSRSLTLANGSLKPADAVRTLCGRAARDADANSSLTAASERSLTLANVSRREREVKTPYPLRTDVGQATPEGDVPAAESEAEQRAAAEVAERLRAMGLQRPDFVVAARARAFVAAGGSASVIDALAEQAGREGARSKAGLVWSWLQEAGRWRDVLLDHAHDARSATTGSEQAEPMQLGSLIQINRVVSQ